MLVSDQRHLLEHCGNLSLAHCNSYVVAVYKSLILQQTMSYEGMEAAVEQCEEVQIEINITNYLHSVCKHLKTLCEENKDNFLENSTCHGVQPLHDLIKEKFRKIMHVAFKPVPNHPELYYFVPPWNTEKLVKMFIPKNKHFFHPHIIRRNRHLPYCQFATRTQIATCTTLSVKTVPLKAIP